MELGDPLNPRIPFAPGLGALIPKEGLLSSSASAPSLSLPRSICRGEFFLGLEVLVVFADDEETWDGVRSSCESYIAVNPSPPPSGAEQGPQKRCRGYGHLWEALAICSLILICQEAAQTWLCSLVLTAPR